MIINCILTQTHISEISLFLEPVCLGCVIIPCYLYPGSTPTTYGKVVNKDELTAAINADLGCFNAKLRSIFLDYSQEDVREWVLVHFVDV
jgi:hypothetical protein